MDVSREVADGGADAGVQRAPVRQVATQTHAGGADAAVAGRQRQQRVDGEAGILIVGGHLLGDLQLVALVGAGPVVGERLGADEFVVGGDCRDDEALAANLAGEAGDGTGHCGRQGVLECWFVEVERMEIGIENHLQMNDM